MDKVYESLVKLLAMSTGCILSSHIELSRDEWESLYAEAKAHQIYLIIYSEASRCGSKDNPELFEKWNRAVLMSAIKQFQLLSNIKNLLCDFRKNNIEVMTLKGLYFKDLYPKPEMRTMSDIDLYVGENSLNDAVQVLENHGYRRKAGSDDPKHLNFVHDNFIPIELHHSLVLKSNRKLAADFNSIIWEGAFYISIDGTELLVPSDINQLIYCCIHMTNHLGKGGFGLRQLSDFNLLVRKIDKVQDLCKIIEQADMYGVGKFMEILLFVCYKLFELNIPKSIIEKYKDSPYILQLINMILDSGVFGRKNTKIALNRSLATYVKDENNTFLFKVRYLFPPIKYLSYDYKYAQKHPVLLPVAWIHRLFKSVFRKDINIGDKIPDKVRIYEYVQLFKWLDIK